MRLLPFAIALALAATPLHAQSRREAPRREAATSSEEAAAANLKMRETGIQGEHQRPDVLFVIPTGRGGPIVSSRLRDYSYDIQEPVVKQWLEGELRIAHQVATRRQGETPDWREAVAAAAKAPVPERPIPMPEMRSLPRAAEPPPATRDVYGAPGDAAQPPRDTYQSPPRGTYQSGPRVTAPGIPREAMQLPPR